ncbi:MAG: hypothetical protein EXR70_08270 [Deltaproteobacteria bacterium]|nr:hypothetical protein [Deltaproteobacteria bacterium]
MAQFIVLMRRLLKASSRRTARLPLLVFFCAAASSFAAQAPANWKVDWDSTVKAVEKEGQLVVYGPRGRDQEMLYGEIVPKAYPKVRVH